MRPTPNSFCKFCLILTLSISQFCFSQTKHRSPQSERTGITPVVGRTTFNTACAGCHGLDGHGSDKAVDIATSARVQHFTDGELANIISNGVPGTGMPAFHTFSGKQVHDIVSYVRSLQGHLQQSSLPGDAKRGKEIFFGKGECASCHTVEGTGGFLGPDLTSHGATSSAEAMREEIVKSPRLPPPGYRAARLSTVNGDRLEGTVRNEDNFSVQLQTKDGNFHLLRRVDLTSFEYTGGSFMPANYRERLTDSELNDLVSYLIAISRKRKITPAVTEKDDIEWD